MTDDIRPTPIKALLDWFILRLINFWIRYVMNKTGRIVTEANLEFLTDSELLEWNDAVNEYRQKIETGEIQ